MQLQYNSITECYQQSGTEQLRARSIIYQYDINNLKSIIKKRKTRTKGKRVVLNSHFLISTQKLYNIIIAAEKDTKKQTNKKMKKEEKKTNKTKNRTKSKREASD